MTEYHKEDSTACMISYMTHDGVRGIESFNEDGWHNGYVHASLMYRFPKTEHNDKIVKERMYGTN